MTISPSSSTKQDILDYLLKHRQATAQQLAEALAISPQAIRRNLKDLETETLIEHQSSQAGMGRPNYIYQLSRHGRDRFPHRYNEFAVSFLDTMLETVGEEQVGVILQKQWQRKAQEYCDRLGSDSLKERVTNLVRLRQEEGYMAELHTIDSSDQPEQFILAEHNCAISEVAESYPKVCDHELEMFAAILSDCTVERTQWLQDGEHRCGYLIQPKQAERVGS